jgi:iron only hydrogenase large subunit-like protein/large-conductance mechanosensitive channel
MNILSINEVDCKDCYKCVRHCPVNAIKVYKGHASVEAERCVLCGSCYGICPQNAKVVRNDIEKAKEVLKSGKTVIASIAPSFFAYYKQPKAGKLLAALKELGINELEQTSRTVKDVSMAHIDAYEPGKTLVISSSCPAVVNLIEKYYPELIKYLAPVVSPAAAHSKLLKKEHADEETAIIFISPCIAKKEELEDSDFNACLTFQELESWIQQENIDINTLVSTDFEKYYSQYSGLFPLLGGLIKRAGLEENSFSKELISISGIEDVKECLSLISKGEIKSGFAEFLSCKGGCVAGPCRPCSHTDKSFIELKMNLLENSKSLYEEEEETLLTKEELYRDYENKSVLQESPSEEKIKAILSLTGKINRENEHNCGACGYSTCREKAIAVIHGMAEAEMCIPYMKEQAEKFISVVIKNTPNGIILLDRDLKIVEVNPAFEKIVDKQAENLINKHISVIMEEEPFSQVNLEEETVIKSTITLNNKKINKIIYSVPDKKLIAAIFVDISDFEAQKNALNKTKQETFTRAQAVIDKQMRVAQEIAGLLGESTAETKVLLGQLMKTLSEE